MTSRTVCSFAGILVLISVPGCAEQLAVAPVLGAAEQESPGSSAGDGARHSLPNDQSGLHELNEEAQPAQISAFPLGSLRGRQHEIRIHSSVDGPRYTISTLDGKILAVEATIDELRANHSELFETIRSTIALRGGYLDASAGVEGSLGAR